mmetsp:Transcript_42745/g.62591  ORF Transcript_42745/g.62591 Transcript_42745/m.62591 type:complete len:688 (-) Transcript_42745:361-2424(-)
MLRPSSAQSASRCFLSAQRFLVRGVNVSHPTCSIPHPTNISQSRGLVSAAQKKALEKKRALNQEQLSGGKPASVATNKTAAPAATQAKSNTSESSSASAKSTTSASNSPSGGGGGGGGSGLVFPALAIIAGLGVALYQRDYMNDVRKQIERSKEKQTETTKQDTSPVEEQVPPPPPLINEEVTPQVLKPDNVLSEDAEETKATVESTVTIETPDLDSKTGDEQPVAQQESLSAAEKVESPVEVLLEEPVPAEPDSSDPSAQEPVPTEPAPVTTDEAQPLEPTITPSTAQNAAEELRESSESKAVSELSIAHFALRENLNETFLKDIDALTPSELRVRLVQLVTEMKERTRWEVVRLKEFQSIAERQISNKYLEILEKQRLEFETLLARRISEVEATMERKAANEMKAKDDEVESLVNAAKKTLNDEHEASLQAEIKNLNSVHEAKFDAELQNQIAQVKEGFSKLLEEKVAALEEMAQRLRNVEKSAQIRRDFETGSQKAHKMSAAALALAAKMETSQGAAAELAALKAIAGSEEGVIASALSKVPDAVSNGEGIPTLPELQTKFDKVHDATRRAAMVPDGQEGLPGQIFGYVFSKLSIEPSASAIEATPTDDTLLQPDYILGRTRRAIQLGDLETAVQELNNLKGQASFTVKDFKRDVTNRLLVNKALKVITLECALMNENMSGAGK